MPNNFVVYLTKTSVSLKFPRDQEALTLTERQAAVYVFSITSAVSIINPMSSLREGCMIHIAKALTAADLTLLSSS